MNLGVDVHSSCVRQQGQKGIQTWMQKLDSEEEGQPGGERDASGGKSLSGAQKVRINMYLFLVNRNQS